jgi:hypothetical protein
LIKAVLTLVLIFNNQFSRFVAIYFKSSLQHLYLIPHPIFSMVACWQKVSILSNFDCFKLDLTWKMDLGVQSVLQIRMIFIQIRIRIHIKISRILIWIPLQILGVYNLTHSIQKFRFNCTRSGNAFRTTGKNLFKTV